MRRKTTHLVEDILGGWCTRDSQGHGTPNMASLYPAYLIGSPMSWGFLEILLISPNKKNPARFARVCQSLPRRRSLVRFAELQRPGCHLAVGEWHHCGLPCGHVWWKRSFVSKLCEAQDTQQPGGGLLRTLFLDEFGDVKLNRLIWIFRSILYWDIWYIVKWHIIFFSRTCNHTLIYMYTSWIINVKTLAPSMNRFKQTSIHSYSTSK